MRAIAFVFILAAVLSGCGGADAPDKQDLSGTITYGDDPIPAGSLTFRPDNSKGNKGPIGTGVIRDGKYTTMPGFGVVGGDYLISVMGYDGVPTTVDGETFEEGKPLFKGEYVIRMALDPGATTIDLKVPKQ